MNRINEQFLREQRDSLQIKVITAENMVRFSEYLPNAARNAEPGSGYTAFGAELYGTACGALELKAGEGYFDITALFVAENARRSGVGTRLLLAAKRYAAERDTAKIYVEFLLSQEEQADTQAFFASCGFYLAETGSSMYTFALSDLAESEPIKKLAASALSCNLVGIANLPRVVEANLRRQAGSAFVEDLAPWNAKGQIIGELSQGIVENDKIRAFVIITSFNGRLYLNSAYADKEYSRQFSVLLAKALLMAAKKYSQLREMCVTTINPASMHLVEKLAGNMADKLTKQTLRAMHWNLEDELASTSGAGRSEAVQTIDGMEILVPKLMRLMDFLEADGYSCDLMLGELPYIMAGTGSLYVLLSYVPVDNGFTRFDLTFTAQLPADDVSTDKLNADNSFTTAFKADGAVFLRYTLPESALPVSEEQFAAALESFTAELVSTL